MNKEDQRNTHPGGAEIVAPVGAEHLRTVVADIFLIMHIGIAGADKRLYPPSSADSPVVAVGEATAVKLAAVVFVFKTRKERDIPHIEMAVMTMKPEEVPLVGLAGPVAEFGLQEVMLQ